MKTVKEANVIPELRRIVPMWELYYILTNFVTFPFLGN
jgi:hypothetical protein